MIQFDQKGPQEFAASEVPVLVKIGDSKPYLSQEVSDLFSIVGDDVLKILDGLEGHNSSYYENLDFIPEGTEVNDRNIVSSNVKSFILENGKIILEKL